MGKKNEISFMNVLLCLLVIFIHVASEPVSKLLKDSAAYTAVLIPWRLSAFVVQGFIFLSGMKLFLCFRRGEKYNYRRFYLSRLTKIVLPYLLAVCIFYLYFCRHGYFPFRLGDLARYMADGMLVSHFYFIIIIVQLYLLLPLWRAVVRHIPPAAGILGALLISLLSGRYLPGAVFALTGREFIYNDRIFTTYIIYWIAGCYAGAHYDVVKAWIKEHTSAVILGYIPIAAAEASMIYLQLVRSAGLLFLEELHMLYCISAISFAFCAAIWLGDIVMKRRLPGIIDRSSYYIYLFHPLVIFIANDKMAGAGITSLKTAMVIRAAAAYCITILLCGGYTEIKKISKKRKRG